MRLFRWIFGTSEAQEAEVLQEGDLAEASQEAYLIKPIHFPFLHKHFFIGTDHDPIKARYDNPSTSVQGIGDFGLPPELWLLIVAQLDIRSAGNLARTSKALYNLLFDDHVDFLSRLYSFLLAPSFSLPPSFPSREQLQEQRVWQNRMRDYELLTRPTPQWLLPQRQVPTEPDLYHPGEEGENNGFVLR